jgi:hypothetical protein
MNPKEHIKHIHFILRRVSYQHLEKEFKGSLDMVSEMFFKLYNARKEVMKFGRFRDLTISVTIDGIHHELFSVMPEDSEWYIHTHNALNVYYQDRIKLRYKELQELISNIIE